MNEFPFDLEFLVRFRECEEALMPDGGWGTDAEGLVLNKLYSFQETVFPTHEELQALPSWKSILRNVPTKFDRKTQ